MGRIIANLSVPASELGVAPPPQPAPAPAATAPDPAAEARAIAEREAAEKKATEAKALADKQAAEAKAAADKKAAVAKALADKKAAEKKAAAAKLAEEKKAADAKALAEKKAEERKKAAEAKADPARIWVQVAGGANEGDLGKAWAAVQAKAPALKSMSGYWTPLRATNRVVTGPFKTDNEARAMVNTLAKQGVSAFPFTSEKGQKMTRLSSK